MVLGQAKTADEAVALLKERTFSGGTARVFGKIYITAHFEITDETGRSVVVEFLDGKPTIRENKVGALTNDPNFAKQLEV